jgi:mono/diheme cytochrome c family protein
VHAPKQPNHLVFPFNIRAGIAGWNALYFKEGTFKPDASHSPEWNRGAYLVTGLGHCAACHTPKNLAQAPIDSEAFSGGKVDNWYAPNITSDAKEGIGTWSVDTISAYLKRGSAQGKGAAFGPMAQTVHDSLSHLTDADLHDIAVYLKALPAKQSYKPGAVESASAERAGANVYLTNCESCHQPDGKGLANAVPPLAGNGVVTAKGPDDIIRAVVGGLPAQASYGPMPGFATVLSPREIADVTNYVRTTWGNGAPATASPDLVNGILPKTETMMAGTHWCKDPGNDPLGKKINDPSTGVTAALQQINDTTLLPTIIKIVGDVRRAAPGAPQADVVNQLTAAYCPVVFKNKAVTPALRAPKLDEFATLVYTELTQQGGGGEQRGRSMQ